MCGDVSRITVIVVMHVHSGDTAAVNCSRQLDSVQLSDEAVTTVSERTSRRRHRRRNREY